MMTGFLSAVFGMVDPEVFSIICFFSVFAAFVVCLSLAIFKTEYGLKKRVWFFLVLAFFCALCKARANFTAEKDLAPLLYGAGIAFFVPLFFIRVKRKEETSESDARREFVRYLDSRIDRGDRINGLDKGSAPQRETDAPLKTETVKRDAVDALDFSHVKNVLQRLETAQLSYADRKQVRDLELLLYEAEHGEYDDSIKGRINEGLGNLLKIMAKHGV